MSCAEEVAARQRLALAQACAFAGVPGTVARQVAAEQGRVGPPLPAAACARSAAERPALRALRCSPGLGVLLQHGPELRLRIGPGGCDDSVSRSLTVWLALWRLGLLPPRYGTERPLRVAVLGAQAAKEGNSPARTAAVFGVLRQLLHLSGVAALDLLLCGPEVGTPTAPPVAIEDDEEEGCCLLRVEYLQGLYHEVIQVQAAPGAAGGGGGGGASQQQQQRLRHEADLIVCFQPGIWGYDSWQPSIQAALCGGAPLVITSYSWEEADDDCGVLEEWGLPPAAWLWDLQPNPYAAAGGRIVEQPRLTAVASSPSSSADAVMDDETQKRDTAAAAAAAAGGGEREGGGEGGEGGEGGGEERHKVTTANKSEEEEEEEEEDEEELGSRTLHDNHHWQCLRWSGSWVPPPQGPEEPEEEGGNIEEEEE
jgi:hypothetical protein